MTVDPRLTRSPAGGLVSATSAAAFVGAAAFADADVEPGAGQDLRGPALGQADDIGDLHLDLALVRGSHGRGEALVGQVVLYGAHRLRPHGSGDGGAERLPDDAPPTLLPFRVIG